jgi:hypothetical protein
MSDFGGTNEIRVLALPKEANDDGDDNDEQDSDATD